MLLTSAERRTQHDFFPIYHLNSNILNRKKSSEEVHFSCSVRFISMQCLNLVLKSSKTSYKSSGDLSVMESNNCFNWKGQVLPVWMRERETWDLKQSQCSGSTGLNGKWRDIHVGCFWCSGFLNILLSKTSLCHIDQLQIFMLSCQEQELLKSLIPLMEGQYIQNTAVVRRRVSYQSII